MDREKVKETLEFVSCLESFDDIIYRKYSMLKVLEESGVDNDCQDIIDKFYEELSALSEAMSLCGFALDKYLQELNELN